MNDAMHLRFIEICLSLNAKSSCSDSYGNLVSLYSGSQRYYHNWSHINGCMEEFDRARSYVQNPAALQLALFYHDAVYDTRAKDNEEKSAQFMQQEMQTCGIPLEALELPHNLIMATKHDIEPASIDEQIIISIDLAGLGKSPEDFDRYGANIRQEYGWVDPETYGRERAAVLQGFLDKKHIYPFFLFREMYEQQARENLQRSIERLLR